MRWVSAFAPLLVVGAFAGCAGEAPQAPVLANPKVLVDRDARNLTHVYVHSAFGDRLYDRIVVTVDNRTAADMNDTFAVDVRLADEHLDLAVDVRGAAANYTLRALVQLPADEDDGARVALWDDEDEAFGEFRGTGLPWQKVMDAAPEPQPEARVR